MAVYAAMIDRMDQNVGRIVASLKKTGQLDNTLLLMLADNGGCAEVLSEKSIGRHIPDKTRDGRPVRRGNNPSIMPGRDDDYQSYGIAWANASNTPFRRYKHWVHEGGIASPLIASWPRGIVRQNAITHENGHIIDLMATCVDIAGARYPESQDGQRILPMEGRSLAPAFQALKVQRNNPFFWEHEGNRAVIDGRWKLVSRYPNRWELYDLDADRCERRDLAASDPGRVERMSTSYDDWAGRCNVRPWDEVRKIPSTDAP
jgi:arylsulfatase